MVALKDLIEEWTIGRGGAVHSLRSNFMRERTLIHKDNNHQIKYKGDFLHDDKIKQQQQQDIEPRSQWFFHWRVSDCVNGCRCWWAGGGLPSSICPHTMNIYVNGWMLVRWVKCLEWSIRQERHNKSTVHLLIAHMHKSLIETGGEMYLDRRLYCSGADGTTTKAIY